MQAEVEEKPITQLVLMLCGRFILPLLLATPTIPHSINYEETGTSEGLWDRLGRRKMTNMSFFDVFKAPSFALVNSAS